MEGGEKPCCTQERLRIETEGGIDQVDDKGRSMPSDVSLICYEGSVMVSDFAGTVRIEVDLDSQHGASLDRNKDLAITLHKQPIRSVKAK